MRLRILLFGLVVGVPLVGVAGPGLTKAPTEVFASKLSDLDIQVTAHQHAVDQQEIEMGKLAQKSGRAAVKKYGGTLVNDHTAADADLTAFAKKHGLTIPDDSSPSAAAKKDNEDMIAKLKTLGGADFDHEFLMMMVAGHEREVTKLEADIAVVENKDLGKLLAKVKPMLQRHLDSAKTLQRAAESSNAAR